MSLRVRIDYELCEANGVCVRLAPEVFQLDDDDRLRLKRERPAAMLRSRVAEAVRRCPKQALAIVDESKT